MIPALDRILYVEDEEMLRTVTNLALTRIGKFTVELCDSGTKAVETAKRFRPDLIMLDVMMPVMDGPATVQALRQINPLVKLIGASGLSQNGQAARAVGVGLEHFLPKPYTAEVMLRLIDTVLKE